MAFYGETEHFDEIQNESEGIKSDEQNKEIENDCEIIITQNNQQNYNDSEVQQSETNIENVNQNNDKNCNYLEEEQKQLNQDKEYADQLQQADLLQHVDQLDDQQLINLCPVILYDMGVIFDDLELLGHQTCNEFPDCQFCEKLISLCQYQSHLKRVHSDFICLICGLVDRNITNQNHRLQCFQQREFGFDDAMNQKLDAIEHLKQCDPVQQ
ncbi:unnamed protein product (macronuclear) [Paramecium tetraurelia]|uniref:C2H2-type domain-containing protein n=1 Tax=Paramecium tetraurelia TaxID=5888 RepID=A0CSN6_PARTE|nr:uncharacterized protein GSPATT00010075001 [Paramecium tetraurelia]CAK73803.1 unnamed protein product [Paramecium tetraurelia]|eukprot:XP_001441200.1 hypothetical protein (macronuclear) [Paramecium tetraurelia strain d4-2]